MIYFDTFSCLVHTLVDYDLSSSAVQFGTLYHMVLGVGPEEFIRGVVYHQTVRPKQIGICDYVPGTPVHRRRLDFGLTAPVRPEHCPANKNC